MEPVTLAIATAAVTQLGTEIAKGAVGEFAKGAAGEAGKSAWGAIRSLFKWDKDPAPEELPVRAAEAMQADPKLVEAVLAELKKADAGLASRMVDGVQINVTARGDAHTAGRDVYDQRGASFGAGTRMGGS